MSYIEFDKLQLINLEYSLSKELLRSNRAGAFSSTTILGCNTRKYHGLLITRQPALDGEHHVLLSSVDETIIQQEADFNFGIHRYKGGYYQPKGHKYFRDFNTEPIPKITFRVGGVFLTKEMVFSHDEARIIIKYTLEDAHSKTLLRLKPFLAFRSRHTLSKANIYADTKYEAMDLGIKMQLYQGYSPLIMQISKKHDYVHVPDWHYNIEYLEEMERGYECLEDLFTPGYFEISLRKGESVYFSAGLEALDPYLLEEIYNKEVTRRTPRNNFENCLINSAHQFISKEDGNIRVVAGFPWYGQRVRDTLVALPGLTLFDNRTENFFAVIDAMVAEMNGPFFAPSQPGVRCVAGSADSPLFLIWALQQYCIINKSKRASVWKKYGNKIKEILEAYRNGYCSHIRMNEAGLIDARDNDRPMTWMNAIVHGKPVTHRMGLAVEVNALWYNAVMFSLELAKLSKDNPWVDRWTSIAHDIPKWFQQTFWDQGRGYLADVVLNGKADWSFRPNQLFATALPYSPLPEEINKLILDKIKAELLTPRGLRSLSPKDLEYHGIYHGNQISRDLAAHQGSVYPWLLGLFTEAYLRIHEQSGLPFIMKLYQGLEPAIFEHGIGTISEVYDGDPPHQYAGAISMAGSVGEVLRMKMIIDTYSSTHQNKTV